MTEEKDSAVMTFKNFNEALNFVLKEEELILNSIARQEPLITWNKLSYINPNFTHNLHFPYCDYFNTSDNDTFIVRRLKSKRYSLKPNLKNRAFLFRGQDKYYDPCTPNLFRNEDQTKFILENVFCDELILLLLSHPLTQLLDIGLPLCNNTIRFEMNLYGLCQHYYNKTPLLDFTSDYNVAKFFATNHYNSETDNYEPCKNGIGVLYYYYLDIQNAFLEKKDGTRLSSIGLQPMERSGRQKGFLLMLNQGQNLNNLVGINKVFFHHDTSISQEAYDAMKGGIELFPNDILSCHWKKVNLATKTISKEALLLNHKLNPNDSFYKIQHQILSNGYKIRNYKPRFTLEELDVYFQDIKNGWWEYFCKKIDFHDSRPFQEEMIKIEKSQNYQWAFNRNKWEKVYKTHTCPLMKYYS